MKNSLYKILCLTLAFLMICSMSACKSNKDKSDNPNWWEDSGTTFVCKDGDTERLLKFRLAKTEMDPTIFHLYSVCMAEVPASWILFQMK